MPITVMKIMLAIHVSPCLTLIHQESYLRVKTKTSLHNTSILAITGIVSNLGSRPQRWDHHCLCCLQNLMSLISHPISKLIRGAHSSNQIVSAHHDNSQPKPSTSSNLLFCTADPRTASLDSSRRYINGVLT